MSVTSTALSGLSAASKDLDVIGNNVANANTDGFKASKTSFADVFAAGSSGLQIGNGVKVAAINQNFSAGSTNLTGRTLDMSLQNNGFFVLRGSNNSEQSFTRAGKFFSDTSGKVTDANGNYLQGFPAVSNTTISSTLADVQIPTSAIPAQASATIAYDINLDAASTVPAGVFNAADPTTYNMRNDVTVYDSLGNSHQLSTFYVKTAANVWDVNVQADGNALTTGSLSFNNNGTFNTSAGLSAIGWNPGGGAAFPQNIDLSYSASSQFGGTSQTFAINQDGYAAGTLTGISIDNDGLISGRYSNGQLRSIAQVAVANFAAPQGLVSVGNTNWAQTNTSGAPQIQTSNSANAIQSGSLEQSNVDLTQQLVDLISAQRYFQANAQTVKAADTIMQTIINIQ